MLKRLTLHLIITLFRNCKFLWKSTIILYFQILYENTKPAWVLMLGGFLYYSLTQSEWGGYSEPVTMHRNLHIRVDFLIWFLHGLLAFIYPRIACKFQVILEHIFFARICFGSNIILWMEYILSVRSWSGDPIFTGHAIYSWLSHDCTCLTGIFDFRYMHLTSHISLIWCRKS
jgi:hypothetical protein